jgi:D-glycero-alpha-D-manno-heptose-7-phosphate kinase
MRDMADECRDTLLEGVGSPHKLGALLDAGWRAKRSLASKISSSDIDAGYARALESGALGGKITGAGGGGFLYFVVPPHKHDAVRAALANMIDVAVEYEPRGARVLSVVKS